MLLSGFVSQFVRTAFGARSARGKTALALAAGIVCIAASDGNAAANRVAEFAAVPFIAPASPGRIDEKISASFKERFDSLQTSITRENLASLTNYLPLTPMTLASLPRHQKIVASGAPIVGIASTYNPIDPNDRDAGNEETASGERYDANGWTAAIRVDLRTKFGGVRFGKNYQPGFALVQSTDRQVIVRINDIGPLKRGRIIDLNERAMRYFDPTLELGLIDKVRVTPLAGQDWALGPVDDDRPVSVAGRFDR
jgi:peptidoglycan lytic transglycosylase